MNEDTFRIIHNRRVERELDRSGTSWYKLADSQRTSRWFNTMVRLASLAIDLWVLSLTTESRARKETLLSEFSELFLRWSDAKLLRNANERESKKFISQTVASLWLLLREKKTFFLKKKRSKTTIFSVSSLSFQTLKWAQLFLSLHTRIGRASLAERHLNGRLCACTAYKPIHAFPVLKRCGRERREPAVHLPW